ncbi:MAG: hypothetical protein MUF31_10520 [Akkermansiaceae bacterium]|jgi:hypothetical protein|nr:hypothetical protein [Akkermansiaceae bacterium]
MNAIIRLTAQDTATIVFHAGQMRQISMDLGHNRYSYGTTKIVSADQRNLTLEQGGDAYGYDLVLEPDPGPILFDLEIVVGPNASLEFTLEGGPQYVAAAGVTTRLVISTPEVTKTVTP